MWGSIQAQSAVDWCAMQSWKNFQKHFFYILWSFSPENGRVRAKIWMIFELPDAIGMEFDSWEELYEYVGSL